MATERDRRLRSLTFVSFLLVLEDRSGSTAIPVLPDLAHLAFLPAATDDGGWVRLGGAVRTRAAVLLQIGGGGILLGVAPDLRRRAMTVHSGLLVIVDAIGARGGSRHLEAATKAADPASLWRRREGLARSPTAGTTSRLFLDGGWERAKPPPFSSFSSSLPPFPSGAPSWRAPPEALAQIKENEIFYT